jgi:hypothetical protein
MTDPEIPYARFYKGPDQAMFEAIEETISEHRHQPAPPFCTCGWNANDWISHLTHEVIQGLRKDGFSIVRNTELEA